MAAAAGGYAVCPLPFYYAMSQAGRAVIAAWHHESDWNSVRTHGLSVPAENAASVPDTHVAPKPSGMFAIVSDVGGSRRLQASVPLAALLASLPDAPSGRLTAAHPRCALAFPRGESYDPKLGHHPADAVELFVPVGRDEGWLRETYPALREASITIENGRAAVRWPTNDARFSRPVCDVLERHPTAPPSFSLEPKCYVLRPALPDAPTDEPPSPLMTWWAALFAMSSLARYHPAVWTRALDANESEIAVDLQETLDAALRVVPPLLQSAISMPAEVREQLHNFVHQQHQNAGDEAANQSSQG